MSIWTIPNKSKKINLKKKSVLTSNISKKAAKKLKKMEDSEDTAK